MALSMSEEQLNLDRIEKNKKNLKKDIVLTDKIERTKDQYQYLSSKQEMELEQVRKLRTHYQKEEESTRLKHHSCQQSLEHQFLTAKMKYEAAMERDMKDLDNTIQYYKGRYKECDDKIESIVKNIQHKTKQVERKQDRLVNQILTPTGKQMVNEILTSSDEEPIEEVVTVKNVVSIPPPAPIVSKPVQGGATRTIQPKKQGVKIVRIQAASDADMSTDYTNAQRDTSDQQAKQKLLDIQEEKYMFAKHAAEEGEKEMITKNSQVKVLKNKMDHLKKVVPYPEDDIFTIENEINVLTREIELIRDQIPKQHRR